MTKYEITKFTARNIANLDDVTFETGGDVLITGKNGVGKSSIKKALMWVLNGATADGEKLINPNASGLPFAEVTLSTGTTSIKFGKEITQKIDPKSGKISRSTEHYFNGLPAKQKDFQAHFESITPIFEIMVDLFGFSNLRADVQRAVLLNHFSTVTDADVVAGCTDLAELNFGSMEPEIYKKTNKAWAVKLGKELESIPRQITALKNQLVDETPINAQRTTLQKTLSGYQSRFEELEQQLLSCDKTRKVENERVNLVTSLNNAQSDKNHCERKIAELDRRLDDLREQWGKAKNFCPTCGQPINADKTAQIRSAICRKADDVQAETAKYQDELNGIDTAIERLQNELEKFSVNGDDVKQKDELNAIIAAQKEISGKIGECQKELSEIETTLKFNEKTRKAIDELKIKHKQLADDMAGHERLADLAEKFILRKSNMVTEEINSHFEHVAFKMFEILKSGEIKSVCDVTLNGVAEDNLSKGEKLFAALDILQAFQKYYGVMLPLIIDDAESYTSNTLGNVPNQKILFKVVEEEGLKVNANA